MKSHAKAFAFIASTAIAMCASSTFAQVLSVSGSATTSTTAIATAREFTVNVNLAGMTGAVGAQATVAYDPLLVEFVEVTGGTDFTTVIFSSHDAANSKVLFATGIDPTAPGAGIEAGNVAVLKFRTIAGACADADAIALSTSFLTTRVTDANGTSLAFTESSTVSVTSLEPFSLVGTPGAVSVAADAGTTAGALVSLTAPTASDSCGTALTVNASRSDSAAMVDAFPVGATTVTYSATDAAGNTATSTVLVTVENYQLLDAAVSLNGSITGSSSRSVRIVAGASSQVVSVSMTDGSGTASNVQVPVAAEYACVTAKDAGHSLSDTGAASVSGVKYAASFALDQGDSNDDNFVDILDFGIYVGDFGAAAAGDISNFNDDANVNSGDFGFISLNFAKSGTTCGAFTGGAPRVSMKVKELRRLGMGHLAAADLNRDGILDPNDIAFYMQHGLPAVKQDRPGTGW